MRQKHPREEGMKNLRIGPIQPRRIRLLRLLRLPRHAPAAPRRQPAATLPAATAQGAEPWARPVQAACLPAPGQFFCQNAANPHAKRQIQGGLRVARQCQSHQHSRQSWPPHWRDTGQRADLVGRFACATATSTKKSGCTQATIRRPRPAL